jgi:hypothetical protein
MPAPPCDFDLKDPSKIGDFLNLVINRLVNGQMEPKVAWPLGYLLNIALKSKHIGEVDEQIPPAKRFQKDDPADGFPDEFGINGDGIELTELPKEEALKILADLNDSELSDRYNELQAAMDKGD